MGASVEAARSRRSAGRAQVAAGERDEGVATLRAAEIELGELGAMRARDEARRELRKLGARAETRGSVATGDSGMASLSTREREVAELVRDRKTNKLIAADLFLSEKTIESHLRNIFFKLEVSSRVEVARAVEREDRARGTLSLGAAPEGGSGGRFRDLSRCRTRRRRRVWWSRSAADTAHHPERKELACCPHHSLGSQGRWPS